MQVSSVLHNLRQRDAYPANQKSPTNSNFIGISIFSSFPYHGTVIQAMSSTKDVEDSFMAVEALNSIDKLQFTPDIRMPLINEQVPSELITSCIATLLMIQVWPEGRESIPDFWSRIAAIQRPAY
ncbi:hypothetical protein V6N12_011595 [Hibiscus sabdariffa]|uniref:Uncharacterized protein n=1 Tax=Hibiscus sabdariffa TaxID=183260 RepID=A0ABR2AYY6_9ROSI